MAWFKRKEKGVKTPTEEKKEAPDGLWYKSPKSKKLYFMPELKANAYVCEEDAYHVRIGSVEYFEILFDNNKFKEIDVNLQSTDPLGFVDNKPYKERIKAAQEKTKLKEACRSAIGKVNGIEIVICCMDFTFIGGSMGTIVGEKICRAIAQSLKKKIPFLMISKSGGARMMEAGLSLMQMARTSARLQQLNEAKIPYISLMTDPTTGGVTASFAMLGDFNIAEPDALIGFAGPRVIKETIGKDLPKGFQKSEFLLEHGFLDFIVDRRQLKTKLTQLLSMIEKNPKPKKKSKIN